MPLGHRPTWLQVATPRYECADCGKVWRHWLRTVARARSRLTRTAGMWALAAVVLDHVPVSSVARILGIAWHTAHSAVAEFGLELLIGHPARFDGVTVIAVHQHCWRHTGFLSGRFVTVIVDLTPVRETLHRSPALEGGHGRLLGLGSPPLAGSSRTPRVTPKALARASHLALASTNATTPVGSSPVAPTLCART
jgi:transposase